MERQYPYQYKVSIQFHKPENNIHDALVYDCGIYRNRLYFLDYGNGIYRYFPFHTIEDIIVEVL